MRKNFEDMILDSDDYGIIDKVFAENLKDRVIIINQEIDENIVEMATMQIIKFNKEDKDIAVEDRKPIRVYISSNGGSVADGFTLIDVMLQSKTPVHTINLSKAYSMGFLIMLAGSKRSGFANSTYLLHDGMKGEISTGSKFKDTAKFYDELDERIKQYVLDRTIIDVKTYNKNFAKEWYMYSDEAKKLGVIQFIVGEDITLDEIL